MTNEHDVSVRLDDRVRLMSAVLAATDWPLKSQNKKPHGTHLHARSTRKFLEVVKNHPAVQSMQGLIDQNAPLEAFFTLALQLSWPDLKMSELPGWVPPKWNEQLADFYVQARLSTWWKNEDAAWQSALHESERMFKDVAFKPMLKTFFGDVPENLIFIPNISYPTDVDLAILSVLDVPDAFTRQKDVIEQVVSNTGTGEGYAYQRIRNLTYIGLIAKIRLDETHARYLQITPDGKELLEAIE